MSLSGSADVFLISLKAGGTGLNLVSAQYVVIFDPWWNPAAEAQAIDRTHRIGQTRTVIAYRLMAEGTVEEITPRVTRIRDRFGRLHILRNGEIKNVINYSRGWTLAVVEMSVAYEDDLKKAIRVITEVTAKLPELMPGKVLGAPQVMGLESMDESCLKVRIEAKVAPRSLLLNPTSTMATRSLPLMTT